jgi:L-amino acid N-acyltransferase YncA
VRDRPPRRPSGRPSDAVEVRDATTADAAAIARVHVRGWRAAYRGQLPDEVLDGLSIEARAERWQEWLGRPHDVLVADDGGVVGFVAVGPCRADAARGAPGGVFSIYLEPRPGDEGIGRRLMDAATRRLAALGYDRASLWVLDTNARTRAFYERGGWRTDGATKREDIGGAAVTEVRYVNDR